jgi:hypothetical protein
MLSEPVYAATSASLTTRCRRRAAGSSGRAPESVRRLAGHEGRVVKPLPAFCLTLKRLLSRNPQLVRRPSLVDDFNNIDIGKLRRPAKAMECGVPTSDVVLGLLSVKI